jgi:hypothetical protein
MRQKNHDASEDSNDNKNVLACRIGSMVGKKAKFEVTYTSGEQIEKYVDEMLSITPKAKELLSFLMVKTKVSPAGK